MVISFLGACIHCMLEQSVSVDHVRFLKKIIRSLVSVTNDQIRKQFLEFIKIPDQKTHNFVEMTYKATNLAWGKELTNFFPFSSQIDNYKEDLFDQKNPSQMVGPWMLESNQKEAIKERKTKLKEFQLKKNIASHIAYKKSCAEFKRLMKRKKKENLTKFCNSLNRHEVLEHFKNSQK